MRPLCIIPARGGSKRFPRKNIAELLGRPLIEYSIRAALDSGLYSSVVVTTEDAEIAEVSVRAGAVVHMRPEGLATDTVRLPEVCLNIIEKYDASGDKPSVFSLLQPTCPLRTVEDIRSSYSLLTNGDANYVVSVSEYEDPPFWALHQAEGGYLEFYWGERYITARQNLPRLLYHNGSIIWARTAAFVREKEFMAGSRILAYMMPVERSVDIDHPYQLKMAECLLKSSGRDFNHGPDLVNNPEVIA